MEVDEFEIAILGELRIHDKNYDLGSFDNSLEEIEGLLFGNGSISMESQMNLVNYQRVDPIVMDGKHSKYPIFKGDNYSWCKHRMEHYVKSTDYECWVIIQKGPLAITVTDSDGNSAVKSEERYIEADYCKVEKNSKAMSILQYGIGDQDINRISGCTSAKEIWDTLSLAYEGTSQEAKDLSKLSLNELMGSLMAHELSLAKRSGESSKARYFTLKSTSSDEEDDGDDEQAMYSRNMADMINSHNPKKFNNSNRKRFQKKRSYSTVACFKYGEKGHLIKDYPKWNEFKYREKRDFAKKDFKHKVMSAIWGVSDSDEDEEIAEESVGLKECLDEIKEKNESLIIQVDILIKERDSLLADLTSCRHDNKQLEQIALFLSDKCSHAKSAFDKVGKLNLDHLAKIKTLTKEFHVAKEFYRKWEGSQNILDSLINQSQKAEEKAGLGFQSNSSVNCNFRN
ncbi:uncharacterized protein LOC141589786 [Silene latifolia]|uniref:uncharacterized protein LOC141589786 n=1 Tax=Silene latifolia TaxID=37657 RepID=UPI003D77968E